MSQETTDKRANGRTERLPKGGEADIAAALCSRSNVRDDAVSKGDCAAASTALDTAEYEQSCIASL